MRDLKTMKAAARKEFQVHLNHPVYHQQNQKAVGYQVVANYQLKMILQRNHHRAHQIRQSAQVKIQVHQANQVPLNSCQAHQNPAVNLQVQNQLVSIFFFVITQWCT